MLNKQFFTSESVTEGHPDKICDQISDAVLDAILAQDPDARVACETCCTTGMVMIMGEISTSCYVRIPSWRRVLPAWLRKRRKSRSMSSCHRMLPTS